MTAMNVDMEPALSSENLPKDLLHLVFARLDVPELSQLRLLSKDWKGEIDTQGSDFSRVLEGTAYPKYIFGLISKDSGEFYCRVFDIKSLRWHSFDINPRDDYCITMGAADGGLVCFVSENTQERLRIIVMNPLTQQKIELPRLIGMGRRRPTPQPSMLQLIMDRQTNQYKVFVMGYTESGGRGPFAQYYDSAIKEWFVVGSPEQSWDRVIGCEYEWDEDDEYYSGERLSPIVYDFAEGRLRYYGGDSIAQPGRPFEINYALLNGRMFVLHKETRPGPASMIRQNESLLTHAYYISEYHLPQKATAWVKVETHSCTPFDDVPEDMHHRFYLHACNGFLMVFVQVGHQLLEGPITHDKYDRGWLYDLSTLEWRSLPKLPGDHSDDGPLDLMCELSWDAKP